MKWLIDHNLSPRLARSLSDCCQEIVHVADVGLEKADDRAVWHFARDNDYIILTKDSDFSDLSIIFGFPPKIVWLRMGNCTTQQVEELLREYIDIIQTFSENDSAALLTLL